MGRDHHKRHRHDGADDGTPPGSPMMMSAVDSSNPTSSSEAANIEAYKQQIHQLQQQLEKFHTLKLQHLPHQAVYEGRADPLTSYELELLRQDNATLKRKLLDLQQQLDPKLAAQNVENAKRLKREHEQMHQENQLLKLQLQDSQHLLQKVKEDFKTEQQKVYQLQEETNRLTSQVYIWQQMHLTNATSQSQSSTHNDHTMAQNEHKESEQDLPDVELQSSPIHEGGSDSPVLPIDD